MEFATIMIILDMMEVVTFLFIGLVLFTYLIHSIMKGK